MKDRLNIRVEHKRVPMSMNDLKIIEMSSNSDIISAYAKSIDSSKQVPTICLEWRMSLVVDILGVSKKIAKNEIQNIMQLMLESSETMINYHSDEELIEFMNSIISCSHICSVKNFGVVFALGLEKDNKPYPLNIVTDIKCDTKNCFREY